MQNFVSSWEKGFRVELFPSAIHVQSESHAGTLAPPDTVGMPGEQKELPVRVLGKVKERLNLGHVCGYSLQSAHSQAPSTGPRNQQ